MKRYDTFPDRKLYELSGKGEEKAFEELVTRYETFVYRVAYGVLSSEEDAADAAQDAFLKLWRSAGSWRGDCEVKTWIYRLAKSAALDAARSRAARTSVPYMISAVSARHTTAARSRAARTSVPLDEAEEAEDTSPTPYEIAERDERARIVRKAIAELPELHREVIEMRELCEMSYREIADAAGIDIGTVKSRISRARAELHVILKKKLGDIRPDGTKDSRPASN